MLYMCAFFVQMTACTVQSVELHRESVDSLHQVVDVNVKVRLYTRLVVRSMQYNICQRFTGSP